MFPTLKQRKPIKLFDSPFLTHLAEDETSCVHLRTVLHHLALHPYHLNDLGHSVGDILNQGLRKYNADLEGILCGYENVKIVSPVGRIVNDSCFIHVDVEADFYIFKPTVDLLLRGVVNKKSKDHVGCLVHKVFNVSLPKPKHGEGWPGHSIELGTLVEVRITHTDFEGRLPHIKGEIVEIVSPPSKDSLHEVQLQFDDEGADVKKMKKRKKGKRIADEFLNSEEHTGNEAADNVQVEVAQPRKKRRKESGSQEDSPKKTKKKSE